MPSQRDREREGARPKVRVGSRLIVNSDNLRRRVERLERIPLRPATARAVLDCYDQNDPMIEPSVSTTEEWRLLGALDPGWVLSGASDKNACGSLELMASWSWWLPAATAGAGGELLQHLWRHSLAIAAIARRTARDAGDPDPEAVWRAGLGARLGWWAVAAVDLTWLVDWWRLDGLTARRQRERDTFGVELPDLGRRLSERWRCEELVVDATWLHSVRAGTLAGVASDAARIGYIQQACELVEQTPWSLNRPADAGRMPSDPRLKMIVAEVQSRTGVPFIATDASVHEERACRQVAILRSRLAESYRQRRRSERLLSEISRPDAVTTVDEWASSAALAWCAEPEVTAARVVWRAGHGAKSGGIVARDGEPPAVGNNREPSLIIPVRAGARYRGELQVWSTAAATPLIDRMDQSIEWRAWQAWSELIAASESSEQRLRLIVSAHREQAELEEERLLRLKLDALGEFAGGAGHELNNPLAVIAGRAQLLMARTNDAHATKSLKVIQTQVKRAHQILRDLIFVARPPEPRQRMCRPSELLRLCLKEFEEPCVARGVGLVAQLDESVPATWADFDGLRHVGEVLLRNALQATPSGGKIQVQSLSAGTAFVWRFIDSGHGIGPEAAAHLFDPFYCGRQAGRGLGLGLPRAALIVEQGEGQLQWTSNPGVETVFSVRMPVRPAPEIAAA